jgi:shikimate kinase
MFGFFFNFVFIDIIYCSANTFLVWAESKFSKIKVQKLRFLNTLEAWSGDVAEALPNRRKSKAMSINGLTICVFFSFNHAMRVNFKYLIIWKLN